VPRATAEPARDARRSDLPPTARRRGRTSDHAIASEAETVVRGLPGIPSCRRGASYRTFTRADNASRSSIAFGSALNETMAK
jgi:hypothetical protein